MMPAGPIAQYDALGCRFGILGGGDVINHGFYPAGIEHPVFTARYQIIYGDRSGNFMAENGIQPQHMDILVGFVDSMRIENLFRNCFAHSSPFREHIVS
jgi:hypothetical protein